MSLEKKLFIGVAVLVCSVLSCAHPVRAQLSPDQIERAVREVDRPVREEAEERVRERLLDPAEIDKPPSPDPTDIKATFFVREIHLVGNDNVSREELEYILADYEGRELSIDDLRVLCRRIEREYTRRGLIAACLIPPQDIHEQEGAVTLQVVESKMGDLIIQQGRWYDPDRIKYYWPMDEGDLLRYDRLSRALDFMNKNPGRHVKAALTAGAKPGTTDVILTSETRFPVHTFMTFDREGSSYTGRERLGYGIRHNNLLMVDDIFMIGRNVGDSFSGTYAYHTVPITPFGTEVMYGYTKSHSRPLKEFEPFGIKSHSEQMSIYFSQDIYRDIERLGELSIGFDSNDRTTRGITGVITRDRLRTFRAKGTYIHRYPGNITYLRPEISQGVNFFGARRRTELSSRGAPNTFFKFNLSADHSKLLPHGLKANWKMRSQLAGDRLPSPEQFSIGGINSVRGYPSQDFSADHAFQQNIELIIPAAFIPRTFELPFETKPLRDSVNGVLFFDQAWGAIRGKQSAGIPEEVHYMSAGFGVRLNLYDQASVRLSWGFPFGDDPISETSSSRFHIYVNFQDRFPELIDRIRQDGRAWRIEKAAWQLLEEDLPEREPELMESFARELEMARRAREQGDLQKAREHYTIVRDAIRSLYVQAEEHLAGIYATRDRLLEMRREARQALRNEDHETAEELFGQIRREAEVGPLVLEIWI